MPSHILIQDVICRAVVECSYGMANELIQKSVPLPETKNGSRNAHVPTYKVQAVQLSINSVLVVKVSGKLLPKENVGFA